MGRWLVVGNLVVGILVCALAAVALQASHDDAERDARGTAENLAGVLVHAVAGEIATVERLLDAVGSAARSGNAALTDGELVRQSQMPGLLRVSVVDAAGREQAGRGTVAWERVAAPVGELARRAFQAEELAVSDPIALDADQWVLALARRIETQAAGERVAVALVPTERLARGLADLRLDPLGAVSLRNTAFSLIARRAADDGAPSPIGSRRVSEEMRQAMRASPLQGSYVARTALDGVERSNVYRRVESYPLFVVLGVPTSAQLASWRRQAVLVVSLVLATLLLMGGGSWQAWRSWKRERAHLQAMHAGQLRNRAVLLAASDGIHVLALDGTLVGLNDAFAEMLGESREALLGKHVSTWDAKLSAQELADGLARHGDGRRHRFTTRHRRVDGSQIDVEVHSVGLTVDGRSMVVCSARDVSLNKRLQVELAEAEARTRELYDRAPCGYHSLDTGGFFAAINSTELRWLGQARETLVGRGRLRDFLAPHSQAVFDTNFSRLVAGDRLDGVELDLLRPEGGVRHVSISSTVATDAAGRFLHCLSVMYDITELQHTRDVLRNLAREQQAMLDNDLVGIVRTRDGRVVWANRAMERIFGLRSDELNGRAVRSFYPDDDSHAAFVRTVAHAFASDGRCRAQVENVRRDGTRIWIDAAGLPLEDGVSLWLLADITKMRQSHLQAERMALHDALTNLPNRRLMNDRLAQAIASARRTEREVFVCAVDLDGFKPVNDAHGHAAGDLLLQTVAQRLQACVRVHDTAARSGGDEFVLVLTELDAESAATVIARVCEEIVKPVQLEDASHVRVSASIGIAVFPHDAGDGPALLQRADEAMYAAKRSGTALARHAAGRHVHPARAHVQWAGSTPGSPA